MQPSRAKVLSIAGIIVVPAVAYYAPLMPELAGAALAVTFIVLKSGLPLAELGLQRPTRFVRSLAVGVIAGVVFVVINRLLITPLIEYLTASPRDLRRFDLLRGNPDALITLLPQVWLAAAIGEEIVYRGYLIPQTTCVLGHWRWAPWLATLFSACLFGLAHWYQGLTGMLVTGVLAILFGLLFLQQRRNLWANIACHGVADTVSLVAIVGGWDRRLDAIGHSWLP